MAVGEPARLTLAVLSLGVLLVACDPATPPPAAASSTPSPAPSSSVAPPATSVPAGSNLALAVALAPKDLPPSAGGLKQTNDGLLGGSPNTDARVFSSSDGAIVLEIDIDAYLSAADATTGYPGFRSAAAKQVAGQSSASNPAVGQHADEFAGTDSGGRSSVSVAFQEGADVAVVTMKSAAGILNPATVEAVAAAQDARIRATP